MKNLAGILILCIFLGCTSPTESSGKLGSGQARSMLKSSCNLISITPSEEDPTVRVVRYHQAKSLSASIKKHDRGLFLAVESRGEFIREGGELGMTVRVVNNTDLAQRIATQDWQPYLFQEAKDSDGVWKPIEYLPWSGCGNSYFSALLEAMTYWEFEAPRYEGPFKTRLRFRLSVGDGVVVYSPEFDGSIYPSQFEQTGSPWPADSLKPERKGGASQVPDEVTYL